MSNQIIISIGREFGSAGHAIAEEIAKHFDIPMYDRKLLNDMAEEKGFDMKELEKYDEVPKRLFARKYDGFSTSPQENVAHLQFEYLKEKAKSGESFVVVGRCSEEVLEEFTCMISIFIRGEEDVKVERIMNLHELSREEAEKLIKQKDKARKSYHDYYCKKDWGSADAYDICINATPFGKEDAVKFLIPMIEYKRNN